MVTGIQPTGVANEDGVLVRRAQGGESGAFDALFDRHYARVFNFSLRLSGDRDDAADIAQTAFVRAFESLAGLRDGQAFAGWIYRIAMNIMRDRAKQRRRKPWIALVDLWRRDGSREEGLEPIEFSDETLEPGRIAETNARNGAIDAAILQLPLEFREVVVLHHLQQMDVREIAKVVGVPEGTVKSRLGRARQRLRQLLRDWVDVGGGES